MEKYAFTMQLNPGMEAEYRRRHDAIWPELVALLREAGVSRLFHPSRPRDRIRCSACSGGATTTPWTRCRTIR